MSAPHVIPSAGGTRFHAHLAAGAADLAAVRRLCAAASPDPMEGQRAAAENGWPCDGRVPRGPHLLVRERRTGELVACARILTEERAAVAGGFRSLSLFDLGPLMNLSGRTLEIARSCVCSDARRSAATHALWSGLAHFMSQNGYRYLLGRASVPLSEQTPAQLARLRLFHRVPSRLRVSPRQPLPNALTICHAAPARVRLPPFLTAALHRGARVCGEACHDPDSNAAAVLILLDARNLPDRDYRHVGVPTGPMRPDTRPAVTLAGTGPAGLRSGISAPWRTEIPRLPVTTPFKGC